MTLHMRAYLDDLGRQLHLTTPKTREILYELRDHIEDSAQEHIDEGVSTEDAFSFAVDGLGASKSVANQLYAVHTKGSWYHTALGILPHILLSLVFALGWWTSLGWLSSLLAASIVISIYGWRKGRPTWTFPWLGYCLVAPIVSWGLAMSAVGYGAWGVLTKGSLPLDIPIYIASFVYFAGSLWIVIRIVSRVARGDWVMASLTVLPIPFIVYWFLFFFTRSGLDSVDQLVIRDINASAAVVFLVLAGATAVFFRVGRRVTRVALLFITAPSIIILAWMSYKGGSGYLALFAFSVASLLVLLGPALLDYKSKASEDYLSPLENTS